MEAEGTSGGGGGIVVGGSTITVDEVVVAKTISVGSTSIVDVHTTVVANCRGINIYIPSMINYCIVSTQI